MTVKLRILESSSIERTPPTPVSAQTLEDARQIVEMVRFGGDAALISCIEKFEDRRAQSVLIDACELEAAYGRLPEATKALLERTALRIKAFALAQRACLTPLETPIEGGVAGHELSPIERVACYAPGGRFPLPSTVLMTVVTARAAGVKDVVLLTPSNSDIMLGAAYIAGANSVLHTGGAHGVSAVAYGTESIKAVDMVVGPGNRWVTAAKSIVSGTVGIDMLAGPSELLVVCDASANPDIVAADLLAQAEHDPDARPILVSTSLAKINEVNRCISEQLESLPTKETAQLALDNGYAVLCKSLDEVMEVVNAIAPEHLELIGDSVEALNGKISHYGGLFVGASAAEVLGDYGAGPNHTLPTGGTARFSGGLSVFTFLRVRTWMRLNDTKASMALLKDAEALGEIEGLFGHARAARMRI